jgi:hypothetical protein
LSTFDDQVAAYLHALSGPDVENAYHSLIELGPAVIPYLESTFKTAVDARTRQTLLRIAWRTQSRQSLPLLRQAVEDGHDQVWREALDGLVALGGPEALEIARQARGRAAGDKRQWFDEAVQQMAEKP